MRWVFKRGDFTCPPSYGMNNTRGSLSQKLYTVERLLGLVEKASFLKEG